MTHRGDALAVLRGMPRDAVSGRFLKGHRYHTATEFKPGQHWRPKKQHWDRAFWEEQYIALKKSAGDIAKELGITENAAYYWMQKHGIRGRTISEARSVKYWGASGEANPMFNRRGTRSSAWKGGKTPLRQQMYSSLEWKKSLSVLRERDPACRLCGSVSKLEVHHIIPFRSAPLLAFEYSNLIRLCVNCHKKADRGGKRMQNKLFATLARKEEPVR